MNKKEVQKRVFKGNKMLPLDKFEWDVKKRIFQSGEDGLCFHFEDIYHCTFITAGGCTFDTGSHCTFNTRDNCTFNVTYECTFKTGIYCTYKLGEIKIHEPPIYFAGSRFAIGVTNKGLVRSGCIEKPIEWWLKNVEDYAERYCYAPEQVAEYKMYVNMIAEWMERLKLNS